VQHFRLETVGPGARAAIAITAIGSVGNAAQVDERNVAFLRERAITYAKEPR
jgi:hypothetical protein